ncbi:MAG: isoleucine--tRNA ligase [Calditrichaeota bacterium]|nr:MAG: isoleucine--tRNA ligase [Calditrichota bacterium]MBL1204408.1 isoleucine--tRNA ligase [Calditrichota bacterium]NOG44237.1 isoleucine--tRNA ligase [Calditrichota bacterium]
MFREVSNKLSLADLEKKILKSWQENKIFEKSLELSKNKPPYIFYEGPPTANGRPGIHHVMARTIKDVVCRYKAMKGFHVPRKAGWDTHGLPVEIAVEKELGLTQKNQIEEFGIDKFNNACRELVNKHIDMDDGWRTLTDRMGYWLDLDHPYITYKNEYIESVWWAIKEIYEKGLVYKGFKIVPQSPTIETPLSSHELSLGYKDVKDPNCFIKLKILETKNPEFENAQLMVWTTTPWTLISNVAVAVGEEIEYVLVHNKRRVKSGDKKIDKEDKLILAKERLTVLDGDYEILKTFPGRDIVGAVYEQIFDFCKIDRDKQPNALTVLPADFVSTSDGTGIVHMAPAFGADDYEMSRLFDLPFLQPVTPGGRFTEGIGEFSNRPVKTFTYGDGHTEQGVDKDVLYSLKQMDKLYRSTTDYLHSYPHCWRTENPIIYYARSSWFVKSPEYKDKMYSLNKEINWQPPEIGAGRFGNWLKEAKEWSLSRDRFWGSPLPIWVSEDGEDHFAIGSIEELKQGTFVKEDGSHVPVSEMADEIDLHRPFVDKVIFEKEGKVYRRTPEIVDVWFDSGSMPFAQLHYPFENKELFEKSFPADFIAEGVDQTRGWFYTLHNISTVLFGKPAFKNIIVNDLILDKQGQKMSKSKGNVVFPNEMMDKYGADALRWYFMSASPPWIPKKFDPEGVAEVQRKFLNTLLNTYSFFVLYANIDQFNPEDKFIPVENRAEIDRWILSKLYSVTKKATAYLDEYDLTKSARIISDYMIDDVSNWYVRRNRRRFWKSESGSDKMAAYQTLYEVLVTVTKLIAPFAPFLSDEIFMNLNKDDSVKSVHHVDYPVVDSKKENLIDTNLEEKMALAQVIVSNARALRNEAQIRVRQPLGELAIFSSNDSDYKYVEEMQSIITEELNVKTIKLVKEKEDIVSLQAKPNFKQLGARAGKMMGKLSAIIKGFSPSDVGDYMKKGELSVFIDGHEFLLQENDVEIIAQPKEGFVAQKDKSLIIALNTELSEELLTEGFAREFVNRIQNLRKEAGFEVIDHIIIEVEKTDDDILEKLNNQKEYICNETLADELKFDKLTSPLKQEIVIDDITMKIGLFKVS